jgi:hypothetical protein
LFQCKERIGTCAFFLILLQPCLALSSPLQSKLTTTTLHEYDNSILGHYTTLSYVWRDANDKRTAFMDGKWPDITAILDSPLRHLRDSKGKLKVWADGICINQSDADERNVQVQQMGFIYQLTRPMIILLGKSTPSDQETILCCLNWPTSTCRLYLGTQVCCHSASCFLNCIQARRSNNTIHKLHWRTTILH